MTIDNALDICWNGKPDEVAFLVEFMLWECSLDQAPERAEVIEWEKVLHKRGGKFERYAKLCHDWLRQNP